MNIIKKEVLAFALAFAFFLCLISTTSAQTAEPELELKQQYQPGETFIGTITGNIEEKITKNNIEFFQGRKQVSFDYDIIQNNDEYFLYIVFTRNGNFTIKINDILYRNDGLKSKSIEKNITIKENFLDENKTQTNILSIKPGFSLTSETSEITLTNKGTQQLNISYTFEQTNENLILASGQTQKINLKPISSLSYLTISSYEINRIPIIFIPLKGEILQNTTQTSITTIPSKLTISTTIQQEKTQKLTLINSEDKIINLISITANISNLEIPLIENTTINAQENYEVNLKYIPSDEQGFISTRLIITYSIVNQTTPNQTTQNQSISIPIEIFIFPEETSPETIDNFKQPDQRSCEDLTGQICGKDERCSGNLTIDRQGKVCCLATCEEKSDLDSEGSLSWLIALGAFILIVIIGLAVYMKIKKTKQSKPDEELDKKTKSYEDKIKKPEKGKQIRGKLEKN